MHSELLRGWRLMILALFSSFASIMATLFTPALPDLAADFQISEGIAQSTVTTYLIGYCFGMLPYGPLANRFGRKKTLIAGLSLAIVASLLAIASGSVKLFWLFCLCRFFQAFGAGAGLKISMTMIADTHSREGASRALASILIPSAVAPAIGIAIGGVLTAQFHWQGCFVFLAIYGMICAIIALLLPETAPALDRHALQIGRIAHALGRQFKDPFLVQHALMLGISTSFVYVFATLAPFIGIEIIGFSPREFGLLSLIPTLGLLMGNYKVRHFSGRLQPRVMMLNGIFVALIGAIIMQISFANHLVNLWTLFFPMAVIYAGGGILYPTIASTVLSESQDKSSASAVMQFLNLGTAVLVVFLVSLFPIRSPLLPLALGLLTIAALFLWLRLKSHHDRIRKR